MVTVNINKLEEANVPDTYVVDACEIGLPPGEFPETLDACGGNGRSLKRVCLPLCR